MKGKPQGVIQVMTLPTLAEIDAAERMQEPSVMHSTVRMTLAEPERVQLVAFIDLSPQ
jgi:hypothetical protein